MPGGYTIELSRTAKQAYLRILGEARACINAGDKSNAKVKHFRMLEEVLDGLIPHSPFDPNRALSGPLSSIFRLKKGRFRICYIGCSRRKKITVLYISDTMRKEGHVTDPYSILTKMVSSGKFDALFDQLGVKRPKRNLASMSVAVQQDHTNALLADYPTEVSRSLLYVHRFVAAQCKCEGDADFCHALAA